MSVKEKNATYLFVKRKTLLKIIDRIGLFEIFPHPILAPLLLGSLSNLANGCNTARFC